MQQANNNKLTDFDVNTNEVIPAMIIKGEKLATRCEICHQSDFFDPAKNVCARCKDLKGLLITANRGATVNTNTTTATTSFSNEASAISFSIPYVVNGNITGYLQQPLVVTLNPIQLLFAKVDRVVEEKIAKISTPKKLALALVLCLVGLSGAVSTALNSVKTAFTGAVPQSVDRSGVKDLKDLSAYKKSNGSFNSTIHSIVNANNITNTATDNSTNQSNNTATDNISWQPIGTLLASTPQGRDKAFNHLGLNKKGSYVIAAFSLGCEQCISLAKELNTLNQSLGNPQSTSNLSSSSNSNSKSKSNSTSKPKADYQLIAVANAGEREISDWQKEHQLNYPIKAISEATMEDLGVVLFPSLIKVVEGKVVGVSQQTKVTRVTRVINE